jgi:hypothetical protein
LDDLAIGRLGDVRRDIRLSIFDCRWSIYLEFHGIDHIEMIEIKVGCFGEKSKRKSRQSAVGNRQSAVNKSIITIEQLNNRTIEQFSSAESTIRRMDEC